MKNSGIFRKKIVFLFLGIGILMTFMIINVFLPTNINKFYAIIINNNNYESQKFYFALIDSYNQGEAGKKHKVPYTHKLTSSETSAIQILTISDINSFNANDVDKFFDETNYNEWGNKTHTIWFKDIDAYDKSIVFNESNNIMQINVSNCHLKSLILNDPAAYFFYVSDSSIDKLVTTASFSADIANVSFKEIELNGENFENQQIHTRYLEIFDFDVYKVNDKIIDFSDDDYEIFISTETGKKIDNYNNIYLGISDNVRHSINSLKLTNLNSEVIGSDGVIKNDVDYLEQDDTLSIFYYHNQEKIELFKFKIFIDANIK